MLRLARDFQNATEGRRRRTQATLFRRDDRCISSDRGVIYTAIGENYIREAQFSARSVRTFLPDTRIVLFTDSPLEDKNAFDDVIRLENLNRRPQLDKLACIKNSPFANTLFLDTDISAALRPSCSIWRANSTSRWHWIVTITIFSRKTRRYPAPFANSIRGRGVQALGADAEDGSGLAGLGGGFLQQKPASPSAIKSQCASPSIPVICVSPLFRSPGDVRQSRKRYSPENFTCSASGNG